jgi:hypothetical protein
MYTIAMDSGGQTRVGASQELGLGIRDGSLRGGLSSDRIRLSERWKELVGPEIPAWEENTEREQCFSNESTGEDGAA